MESRGNLPRVAKGSAPVYISEKIIRRACSGTKLSLARIRRLVLKGGVTIRGTLRKIDFGSCTGRLESLEHLDLGNNDIVHIEHLDQFAGVLRELSLANNKISRIKNLRPVASTLEVLNLNGNTVARIPEAISQLVCLRVLGLASNRISVLDDFKRLSQLPALAQLEVRDNPCTQTLSARDFVIFNLPGLDMLDRRLLTQRDRDAALKRFGVASSARVHELEKQLKAHREKEEQLQTELKARDVASSKALRAALRRSEAQHEEKERELEEQAKIATRLLELKSSQLARAEEVTTGLDLLRVSKIEPTASPASGRPSVRRGRATKILSKSRALVGSPGISQQLFADREGRRIEVSDLDQIPSDALLRHQGTTASEASPNRTAAPSSSSVDKQNADPRSSAAQYLFLAPADIPRLLQREYRESQRWQGEVSELQLQLRDVEAQIADIARSVVGSIAGSGATAAGSSNADVQTSSTSDDADADSDSDSSGDSVNLRRTKQAKTRILKRTMRQSWAQSRQDLLGTAVAAQDACGGERLGEVRRQELAFRLTASATIASLRAHRVALEALEKQAAFGDDLKSAPPNTRSDSLEIALGTQLFSGGPAARAELMREMDTMSNELADVRRQLKDISAEGRTLDTAAVAFEVPDTYDMRLDVQTPQRKRLAHLQDERKQLVSQYDLAAGHLERHLAASTQLEVFLALLGIAVNLDSVESDESENDSLRASSMEEATTAASTDAEESTIVGWNLADLASARAQQQRAQNLEDQVIGGHQEVLKLLAQPQATDEADCAAEQTSALSSESSTESNSDPSEPPYQTDVGKSRRQAFADDTVGNTLDVTEFSPADRSLSATSGMQGEWRNVVSLLVERLGQGRGDSYSRKRSSASSALPQSAAAAASASAARLGVGRRNRRADASPVHLDQDLRARILGLPELGRQRMEQLLSALLALRHDGLLGSDSEFDGESDSDLNRASSHAVHAEVNRLQTDKDEIAKRQARLERLLSQEQELKTRVALLETRASAARDARQKDMSAAANARRELLAMVARQREVHAEFSEVNPKMRVAREQLTEVARLVLEKVRKRDDLNAACIELEERRTNALELLATLEVQVESLRKEVDSHERTASQVLHGEEEASRMRVELHHLRAACAAEQAQFNKIKSAATSEASTLKRRCLELEQQAEAFEAKAADSEQRFEAQQTQLQSDVALLNRNLEELYARREAALQSLHRDKGHAERADAAREEVEAAEKELGQLEASITQLRAAQQSLAPAREAAASAQGVLSSVSQRASAADAELHRLEQECRAESAALRLKQNELKLTEASIEAAATELRAKKQAVRKFSEQAAAVADVGERLRAMERQRVAVTANYAQAVSRQEAVAQEMEITKREVARLEKRAARAVAQEAAATARATQARAHLKAVEDEAQHQASIKVKLEPHNAALRAQGDKMAAALEQLQEEHAKTLAQVQAVHKQREAATDSLAEAEEALRSAKFAHADAVRELEQQKVEAERALQRLQKEVDIKKAERDDLDAAARGLAPRLRQDQKQHTLLRNDMLQLRNDIVTLQEQHDAIAQKLADDRAEVRQLAGQKSHLAHSVSLAREEQQRTSLQLETTRGELQVLRGEAQALVGTTAEKRAQFQALRAEVEVHASLQSAKQELAVVEERLAQQTALLEVRQKSMTTVHGSTSSSLAAKQRELELVSQQLTTQRSKLEAAKRQQKETEAAAAEVQMSLERDRAHLDTLQAKIAAARADSVRSQTECHGAIQQFEQIKGELEAAKHRLRAADAAVAGRQKELGELGTIIESRVLERDHSMQIGLQKHQETQRAEARLNTLRTRAQILEAQVEEQEKARKDCEVKVSAVESTLVTLERQKLNAESELMKLDLETQTMSRAKLELEREVQRLRITEGELSERYHQVPLLNAELTDATEELDDLRSQLRNLRSATEQANTQRASSEEARLRAESDLRRARSFAETASADVSRLKSERDQLERSVKALAEQQRTLEDAARDAQTQSSREAAEARAARAQLADQRREVAQATLQLTQLRDAAAAAAADAAAVQADLATARAAQETLEAQAAHAQRAWEMGQQVAQSGAKAADSKRRGALEDVQNLERRRRHLASEIEHATRELNELRQHLANERGLAVGNVGQIETLAQAAQKQAKDAQADCQSWVQRAEAARAEVAAMAQKKELLAAQLKRLGQESQALKEQMDRHERRRARLQAQHRHHKPQGENEEKGHAAAPPAPATLPLATSPDQRQRPIVPAWGHRGVRLLDSMPVSDLSSEGPATTAVSSGSDGKSIESSRHLHAATNQSTRVMLAHDDHLAHSERRGARAQRTAGLNGAAGLASNLESQLAASAKTRKGQGMAPSSRYSTLMNQLRQNDGLLSGSSDSQ